MKVLFCVLLCALAFSAVLALTVKEKNIANFAVGELGRGYRLIRVTSVESQVSNILFLFLIQISVQLYLSSNENASFLKSCVC
jgi:hypothetical protein